jgi:hypothetical protein
MADRKSLGFIGFMFGGITVAVMVMGLFVVRSHVDGRIMFDDGARPVVSASLPTLVR